ncbi:hypothetical protein [Marinococcus luteus]|uniref:hypothetical protein n=1 Tax=Marinococcus luteus TaxID=1122204 RepID=UPI002ACCEBB0|nr:hypothetical protein [Marinococcus luteus]MDZ5783131.1 hypothetical protein [Marinococcus luteus]
MRTIDLEQVIMTVLKQQQNEMEIASLVRNVAQSFCSYVHAKEINNIINNMEKRKILRKKEVCFRFFNSGFKKRINIVPGRYHETLKAALPFIQGSLPLLYSN